MNITTSGPGRASIGSNIGRMYAIAAANQAFFLMPIIVLFFQENGLSLQQVFVLQGLFAGASMVLEIPSGYLSDRWGRKPTMVSGSIFGICGILVYALSTTFWGFLIGEMCFAVMLSFYSGTQEAMITDTLIELDRLEENRRTMGQLHFYGLLSQAIASVVGGFLAIVALRAVVFATLPPLVVGLLLTLLLREPKRHKLQEPHHLKAMWNITSQALVKSVPLRSIMLVYAIIASLTFALVWFSQAYQVEIGLPLPLFGVVQAVIMAGTALIARQMHTLEKKVDDRIMLMAIAAVVVVSYVALGFINSVWGIAFLFMGRAMWGAVTPLTSDMISRLTTSEVRATVLSTRSLAGNLAFSVIGPVMGYLTNVLSLNQAALIIGVAAGTIMPLIFLRLAPVWKQVPK